jgi:hypothetical protein
MPIIPIIVSRKDKNVGAIGCKIKNNNIIGPNTATA